MTRGDRIWAAVGGAAGGMLLLAYVFLADARYPDLLAPFRPH